MKEEVYLELIAEDHNKAVEWWIKTTSEKLNALVEAEYQKAFPDGPWDKNRFLRVLPDAIIDAAYM